MENCTSKSCLAILYILLYSILLHVSQAQIVFVHTNINFRGYSIRVRIKDCSNLPDTMSQRVSSIDTLDNCVRLFSGKNCNGDSVELLPNSPSHNNLKYWRFDDTARSVGPCRDPCDVNVTGVHSSESFQIQLFSSADFEGTFRNVAVNGCTVIPEDSNIPINSVNTNGNCIQVYNNVGCEREIDGFDHKSVELRRGTPFHENFEKWEFPGIKAVSHCAYKCHVKENVTMNAHQSADEVSNNRANKSMKVVMSHMTNKTTIQPVSETQTSFQWPLHILLIAIGAPIIVSLVITLLAILIVLRRYLPKANVVKILPENEMQEIRNQNAVGVEGNHSKVENNTDNSQMSGLVNVGFVYM